MSYPISSYETDCTTFTIPFQSSISVGKIPSSNVNLRLKNNSQVFNQFKAMQKRWPLKRDFESNFIKIFINFLCRI